MDKKLNVNTVELLSRLAHEINRAYCDGIAEGYLPQLAQVYPRQPEWEDAPDWQKDSCRAGVRAVLNGDAETPAQQHELWMKQKLDNGWRFGPTKDAERKTHPCLLPYEQLPLEQRVKDHLFRASVLRGLNMLCDYATDLA